jgi:HK97 family phage prohead protease
MEWEKRHTEEIRATEDGKLVGYAAVWDSMSEDLGGVREVIRPGAFNRTLKESPDVLALVEHDKTKVLGRTSNGTARVEPDSKGLRVEIDPADTSYARDLQELVRRGDVAGMSFRFKPYEGGARMDLSTSPPTRIVEEARLREVSVVVEPAYPETSVDVRALRQEIRSSIDLKRKRLDLERLK